MDRALPALLAILLAACTADAPMREAEDSPEPSTSAETPGPPVDVEVRASHPNEGVALPYFNGVELAEDRVNDSGGIGGRELRIPLNENIPAGFSPVASIRIGFPGPTTDDPAAASQRRRPVIHVGGDLYTEQRMHRYSFQTEIPLRWQARVLARYLVVDRGIDDVIVAATPESIDDVEAAFAEEGIAPAAVAPIHAEKFSSSSFAEAAREHDAVVLLAHPTLIGPVLDHLTAGDGPAPVIAVDASWMTSGIQLPPGSVACYPYTWAGWADMLPRVSTFRRDFEARFGESPTGAEQEGYDAVMALAEALERTGGEGGDALVRALEDFRDETYSSTPVRLGPDDHVFAEESHLGLFAVTDPSGAPPGEAFGDVPWRPIMRTFTTDGEKVNLLDRDKRIFFPFWRPKRPTPVYRRSDFGIVTRPSDPLH